MTATTVRARARARREEHAQCRRRRLTVVVGKELQSLSLCTLSRGPWLDVGTWLDDALPNLHNLTAHAGATMPGGCTGAKCLWFNESAPHVKTDMFVVQGMNGPWADRCQSGGTLSLPSSNAPKIGESATVVTLAPAAQACRVCGTCTVGI